MKACMTSSIIRQRLAQAQTLSAAIYNCLIRYIWDNNKRLEY